MSQGAPRRLADDCFALPRGVDWTPVDVALDRLRTGLACVCPAEDVPLAAAAGRVLAAPACALRDNPPAANAAVDGYAFAFAEGAEGRDLALHPGRAAAGHPWAGALPEGAALRILTGAEIPAGADTVVLDEDCTTAEGRVRFPQPRRRGANIRKRGEDAATGDVVLAPGRRLGPGEIARAAVVGIHTLSLRRRLRVGLLSTGDELLQPGADPQAPGIFDANRPMLSAFVSAQGHLAVDLGAVPDSAAAVRAALDRGAAEADAVLTTGGASTGDEDHVSRLLREEGRIETWRIAIKPGRPLALGLWKDIPVFGLPGNPVAAFVCALIFARPAFRVLAGQAWAHPQGFDVPAAFEKRKKPGRREYLRARLDARGRAEVFRSEGSGLVGGLSWSDGLVELPDAAQEIAPGDPVRYLPYTSFGL